MAVKLPGGEEITPKRHTVLDGAIIIAVFRKRLDWHHIHGFPIGQLFLEPRFDLIKDIISRFRSPVAAYPFVPARLAALGNSLDFLLVDNGVELFAKAFALGNGLDLLPLYDATTIREGAGSPATPNSAFGLVP